MTRLRFFMLILIVAGLSTGATAAAANADQARIAAVDASGFPLIRVTVLAPRGSTTVHLRENGQPAVGLSATNLGQSKAIVLAVDRSESMRGRPIQNAILAAKQFASAAGPADHVGVVMFGRSAITLTHGETGSSDATSALSDITVDTSSGTALYDAIFAAAGQLRADSRPGRAIVVITDGRDVSSLHSLSEAIRAAQRAHASVYTIGIGGPSFTPTELRQIAADTGGTYRQTAKATELASTYASLEDELTKTWQLTYDTPSRPGDTLHLLAIVPGAGTAAKAVSLAGSGNSATAEAPTSLIPSAGYSTAGTIGISLLAGLLVLVACGFWFASRQGSWVKARLEPHLGVVRAASKTRRREHRTATRTQVVDGIEGVFANLRQFRAVQSMIQRADLPLRAGELIAICGGVAFFIGLIAAVAMGSPIAALLGMAIGFSLPLLFVRMKATARLRRFENQLPDLLITVAASLKAGHSFRQGIQSAVEEGAEPAAKEFKRVLNETQLGKTMDDALGDMAERVGSKNFAFVITAVTIQRQIGGSLAGLFDMVAETVRQRQQFARKIRGLTAMGRMAAYTLTGLPFFIAIAVTAMNPRFMSPLYHTSTGHELIYAGLAMMTMGSLMLKKIVSFKG
jgi:tight adherence protein B